MADLNDREQLVLQQIISQYIVTANPVGSRTISKQSDLSLSPASIRNIMSDLEEKGYIGHPHTSAGRVPTDLGYRFYVDCVMERQGLDEEDRRFISSHFSSIIPPEIETIVRESTRLLGEISQQLAFISTPHIGAGVLTRIDMIAVSSSKIMVILTIEGGLVKTIVLEVDAEIGRGALDHICSLLNERLTGLTLRQIRETFSERMRDAVPDEKLIELFIQASDRLFSDRLDDARLYIDGMRGVMRQPEFGDPDRMRDIIDIVENRNVIVHVLDTLGDDASIAIRIGSENSEERLREYSVIAAPYRVGPMVGMLSILGPRRMNYGRMISILDYLSSIISTQTTR